MQKEDVFDSNSFEITNYDDSSFKFINQFKTEEKLSYAWYIIDEDTKVAVDKIEYSNSNELEYRFKVAMRYTVRG